MYIYTFTYIYINFNTLYNVHKSLKHYARYEKTEDILFVTYI